MKKLLLLVTVLGFLVGTMSRAGLPEKLRVLSIDLGNASIGTPGLPGGEVAEELRSLLEKADPDVICLQGATDWESCERICSLKPGFKLVTCSAFEAKAPNTVAPQVAILTKDRAVISWVEQIPDGSGFAFAVLQTGSRKLGLFSIHTVKGSTAAAPVTERLLAEVAKVKRFPQNRPDSFLLAGSPLAKLPPITDAGFQTIAVEPPISAAQSRSEFWVVNAGFIARPRSVQIKGVTAPAIVCDFDVASSFPTKFAYQTPLLFAGETPTSVQAALTPVPAPETQSYVWPIAVGGGFVVIVMLILFRSVKPNTSMQLVPMNGANALTNPNQEAVRSNLLVWMKSMFVQRLLSQRQQLLTAEDEATKRTLAIEEKLSSLQTTL
ncbi:MAG: endonuclease/exonuclease/phosphatase family protein, partial [Limisphaerales bacterium]